MQGDFLMSEFLDDADFYDSDDFENSGCIVNISRYNNNIDDDLDAGDAPEFETGKLPHPIKGVWFSLNNSLPD